MNAVNRFSQRFVDEINKPNPRFVYAVKIDYTTTVRAHTGVGDLIFNNEVYIGVGNLGEIGPITDDNSTSPTQLTLTLTGLDATLVSQIINDRNNNRRVRIYWGVLDEDDRVADSVLLFSGSTVSQSYLYDKANASVTVTVADRLIDWSRKASNRFSDESHRADTGSLGDRIMRFIEQVSQRPIYWGSSRDAAGFRYED